jgi:hypothetical protein
VNCDYRGGALLVAALVSAATFAQSTTTQAKDDSAYDPAPWLQDLTQIEDALATKYANLEWLVFEHETDLTQLFDDTGKRISSATNATEARAALDRMMRRIGDGHVGIRWPTQTSSIRQSPYADCAALGYDAHMYGESVAVRMPDYQPLRSAKSAAFPAGTIEVGRHMVGVVQIGIFAPQGIPSLCGAALAALKIKPADPCDEACSERIEIWAANQMSTDLAAQIRAVKFAGADTLLIDIANNGGGTEWAEAAARVVTDVPLRSERLGFVRGQHWAQNFAALEADVRRAAADAENGDRTYLTGLADDLKARRREAETHCDSKPYWRGERPSCQLLGSGWYATGLLPSDSAKLRGKTWASLVFSPAKFNYAPALWRGPVIVLINQYTGSAATEFAAVLQDNHAAIILGTPSISGGCGHTNGGTPTTLKNSGGVFDVPDCARFRADGSNEVMGIQPDVLVGLTPGDGPHRQGVRVKAKLAEAVKRALKLAQLRARDER